MILTEDQVSTITNALRLAADKFDENAHAIKATHPGLAEQFFRQRVDSILLADLLEDCNEISVKQI